MSLARTQDEYLLIVGLLSCMRSKTDDMDVYLSSDEAMEIVQLRLAKFRALPRTVDSFDP